MKTDDPLLGSLGELLKIGVLAMKPVFISILKMVQVGNGGEIPLMWPCFLSLESWVEKEMLLAIGRRSTKFRLNRSISMLPPTIAKPILPGSTSWAPERGEDVYWQQASLPDELLLVVKEMADAGFRVRWHREMHPELG